jgi:hypothetical protein
MMDIHAELLDRLRIAFDRAMAANVGIAGQIVEQTRFVSRCALEEREAERGQPLSA